MSEYPQSPSTPSAPSNSTMAIVSLVSGILGWTALPLLGSIVAVVTGHMAKREIEESRGTLGGDGFATAGLILGYSSLVLGVLGICVAIAIFFFTFVIASGEFSLLPVMLAF